IANGLCKQLCVKYFPQLPVVAGVVEPSSRKEWTLDLAYIWNGNASSTDRYLDESIVNTLDPRERFLGGYSFWLSKAHSDPDVPESLIYKLNASFCIITEINIKPFLAYFQPGLPIYSAKSLRFRVGHLKSSTDVESDRVQFPTEQWVDDKFIWTYTSQEFSMTQ
ncbi:hypothetical protein RJ640_013957, partial [Escallonia rubra]